ncbi:MAG: hypothetical protein HeimC3_18450 [Candidatus Heimdallarchaeota archaeon LC_3]|nr:MAG: hypothetical protein HeimC3_18450 [Candidatus Heimdallarchaeota archaeon LC_3]
MSCPNCQEIILDYSVKCPNCGRVLLSDSEVNNIRTWLYSSSDEISNKLGENGLAISVKKKSIPKGRKLFKIDPIVWALLSGGIRSYSKHFPTYFGLIILYIILLSSIAGAFSLLDQKIEILFPGFAPLQIIVGGGLNFLLVGLVATLGQDFAYKKTLESGELGVQFKFQGATWRMYSYVMGMIALFITYFILWAAFFHVPMLLNEEVWINNVGFYPSGPPHLIYRFVLMVILLAILLMFQIIFFFSTVRGMYFVFQLDRNTVPTEAVDGMLIIIGLLYGMLVMIFRIFPVFGHELVTLIIFIVPGTVLVPILSYAMAHLKTASIISITTEN